jgi:RHS repeat-associated protein
MRDGAGVTSAVLEDGSSSYTSGVSLHTAGATTFDNLDFLGTSSLQTNSSQTTTATRTYDAFGSLVSSSGTPTGPFGFVGAQGYQEDGDSGLKLLGHRYYDPSTGRFLTRDRAKDGRDWYVYTSNNPLKSVDPNGDTNLRWIQLAFEIICAHLQEQPVYPENPNLPEPPGITGKSGGGGSGDGGGNGDGTGGSDDNSAKWTAIAEGLLLVAVIIAAPETGGGSILLLPAL